MGHDCVTPVTGVTLIGTDQAAPRGHRYVLLTNNGQEGTRSSLSGVQFEWITGLEGSIVISLLHFIG